VKFLEPVAGIGKEKLAHRTSMLVCIVNGLTPVRGVARGPDLEMHTPRGEYVRSHREPAVLLEA
jgi:hypothetical protein